MIIYNRENKRLVIPNALGNFGNAGGGSGSGLTPEEVQEMIDESISAYDTEVQVDLEDIRENVSGNTEDIEELSGATVALKEQVDNISLSGITGDVTALSAATVSLSEDLSELSGATNYMRSDINDLSGATDNIRSGIETLSGSTVALSQTVDGKQDALTAGNGIDLSENTISVKIGEGLGFSGNTLVVSGISGGESNYLIVDSLSGITDPYEGLEAYVRERTDSVVYTGYTIDASQISEGYVAHIYYDGSNENAVYRSGDIFHWDWDNSADGALRQREDYFYTINSEHTVFTVLMNNPDAYVTFEEGVTTATTSTTIDVFHKAVTYRYNGTAWEQYQPPKVYYLDELTRAELVALHTEISRYEETTFPAGNYRFFVTNMNNDEYQGRFELFVARFYGGGNVSFSGVMQSRYNRTLLQRGYELTSEGDFYSSYSENTYIPDPAYDAFVVAEYDNDMCLTGITHNTKATIWESYKSEGKEGYTRKTIIAYVHTGDVMPARFNLIYTEGDFSVDEGNAALHFGAVYNAVSDSSLHSVRFRLKKDTVNDVYTVDNITEYSYSRTS